MKCPKCGYQRQDRDDQFVAATECPACSVVYAKCTPAVSAAPAPDGRAEGAVPQASPVHEASLRQARERVEMRLRKRKDMEQQDEQRRVTLERARRITDETMRQRREQRSEEPDAVTLTETPTAEPAHDPALAAATEGVVLAQDVAHPLALSDHAQTDGVDTPAVAPQAPASERAEPSLAQDTAPELLSSETLDAPDGSDDPADGENEVPAVSAAPPEGDTPQPATSALRPTIAWVVLGAGVLGALICWFTIGTGFAMVENPSGRGTGLFTLGLLLGFAYLATGALGFVLFRAAARFAAQLAEMRNQMGLDASVPASADLEVRTPPAEAQTI